MFYVYVVNKSSFLLFFVFFIFQLQTTPNNNNINTISQNNSQINSQNISNSNNNLNNIINTEEPRRKRQEASRPNHILLFTIINPVYPITVVSFIRENASIKKKTEFIIIKYID